MHHPTDRIIHTTAFGTPVVEHWLGREIAQWVHPMKDRSDLTEFRVAFNGNRGSVTLLGHTHLWRQEEDAMRPRGGYGGGGGGGDQNQQFNCRRRSRLSCRSQFSQERCRGGGTKTGGSTAGGGPVCEAYPWLRYPWSAGRVSFLNSPALRHPDRRQADPRLSILQLRMSYRLRW